MINIWRTINPRALGAAALRRLAAVAMVAGTCGTFVNPAAAQGATHIATAPIDFTLDVSNLRIPRDAPIGNEYDGPFYSLSSFRLDNLSETPSTWVKTCSLNKTITVTGTPVAGSTKLFHTNVPGLAVRFRYTGGQNGGYLDAPNTESNVIFYVTENTNPNNELAKFAVYGHYRNIKIVRIGPIGGAGQVTAAMPVMTITWSGACIGGSVSSNTYINDLPTTPAATCSVTTPSLTVAMPTATLANFSGVGIESSVYKDFSIGLDCANMEIAAGTRYGDHNGKVMVTFTDLNDTSNRTSVLKTSDAPGKAWGVGIQLRRGTTGEVIYLGPDSAAAGTLGQYQVGSGPTVTSIPLRARYYQTGPISAGTVEARASFTLSYQ